ncbi:DUF4256 domain-containing protein [Massilia sp. PAMC28688]|uniref:DUF4256 domain-containing protein n=1 Tax=Massilia sp. PAMC28688 TaxID=2861283 RepID=UPI001C62CCD0|nr:DUF4256 domain-containing protein [Massilia sp. PAMC28688]QYF94078.1 DUF4256 domain-containing protein [Massilia sp. PAMC28688]
MKTDQHRTLLATLQERFAAHPERHPGCHWHDVEQRLRAQAAKLQTLHEMEQTGGEPDVTGYDKTSGEFIFCDCAPESPTGRRSTCYDQQALDARKEAKPKHSAVGMAAAMGAALLTEAQYRELQQLGPFDLKTSSWLATPPEVRQLGGAIFGDQRYGRVFIYHNGAQSYYAARGFRCQLRV